MIDVIIPVYKSCKTIGKTLSSIMSQHCIKILNIYLVIDGDKDNYKDLVSYYSNYMNIKLLELKENVGPGVARQYGLENSNSEYVMFIDSDDEFYDESSIFKLYNSIGNNDISYGKIYRKIDDEEFIQHNFCNLHGKLYRRDFLIKNNIKFNKYYYHEDNAFNHLCFFCTSLTSEIDDIVYKYNFSNLSLTFNKDRVESLDVYIKSMTWLFKETEKRENLNKHMVAISIVSTMYFCYFNYMLHENENYDIFQKMSFLKEEYKKYNKLVTEEEKIERFIRFNDYPVIPSLTFDDFVRKIY